MNNRTVPPTSICPPALELEKVGLGLGTSWIGTNTTMLRRGVFPNKHLDPEGIDAEKTPANAVGLSEKGDGSIIEVEEYEHPTGRNQYHGVIYSFLASILRSYYYPDTKEVSKDCQATHLVLAIFQHVEELTWADSPNCDTRRSGNGMRILHCCKCTTGWTSSAK